MKHVVLIRIWSCCLLLTFFIVLVACDGPEGASQSTSPTPVPELAHRGFVSVMECVQNTQEYSRSLFKQANALVAQSVESLVSGNSDGSVAYVNLLDNAPAKPSNSVLTIRIPAIPAFPKAPTIIPTPTVDPQDPYGSVNAQSTVAAGDASVSATYNNQIKAVQAQLDSAKQEVAAWANQLRSLNPSYGFGPPDIWQCLQLASHRFNGSGGQKYIVLAGALPDPGDQSTWYKLDGGHVHLRWIDMGCSSIESCKSGEDAWGQALNAAGVHDLRFYDAGESQILTTIY